MSRTGWAGPYPEYSTFGTAWDTYVPDGHPLDTPSHILGSPPPLGTYPTDYGYSSEGWFDGTNGENGVMHRWPAGTPLDGPGGTSAEVPAPLAGLGGTGVVWPTAGGYGYGLGDADFGRPANQGVGNTLGTNRGLMLGGNNSGVVAHWSQQISLYLQSGGAVLTGASGAYTNSHNRADGYNPDFWWTNGIANSTTGYYNTESGMAVWHDTPTTWRFTTTGGGAIATNVASGQWVTMEVRWDFSSTQLSCIHNLWAINPSTGAPTALIGSYTIAPGLLFQNPTSVSSQGGPRYDWTTIFPGTWNSYDHLTIGPEGVGTALAIGVTPDWNAGPSHGLLGDMNNDGATDNFDISPFEQSLVNFSAYLTTYGGVGPGGTLDAGEATWRGDINGDLALDNFDISPFEFYIVNGHYPSAPVPEPSTFVLLGLGGVGLLVSRFRKSLSAKWLKVAAVLLVVTLAVSVSTAQASTMFLSTTSTNPALINPTITMLPSSSATLYVFWRPTTELVENQTDYPGYTQNEQLSGWSHNLVDDNAIISTTTYTFLNPTTGGSPRWGATNAGTSSGTTLVQTANAVKVGGSNLGFTATTAQGFSNVGGGVWRLATLTFSSGATPGTTHLKEQVGPSGISFQLNPNARSINFGFGDAAINSNSFNTGTTVADATVVVVPEPGTLALLGMGAVGLAAIARRRRQRAA